MNHARDAILAWFCVFLLASPALAARKVDHSAFPVLKGPFKDGPSVTKACLTCHMQSAREIMETPHWLWKGEETAVPGSDGKPRRIGKANLINNFCIGIQSNEAACTRCHIGFGWKDKSFDFSDPTRVDCLVCHDTTGEYVRPTSKEDHESAVVLEADWGVIARNVGPTSIQTCGACHFSGGGGDAVKHGDLDPTLTEATRDLDLHMATDGLGFTCSTCHQGEEVPHHITGHSGSVSVRTGETLACSKCHGDKPHGREFIHRTRKERKAGEKLGSSEESPEHSARHNWHAKRIACQTCHIPRFAREMPTKTWWDWSTAGRLDNDGKPFTELNEDGDITYLSIKGDFKWESNIVPEYRWYDGTHKRYLLGEKFDPSKILVLNPPQGDPAAGTKIWPFKLMRGRQIFDAKNNYLIQPKLSGPRGSGAYWSDFDWGKASRIGMEYVGLPYSGEYGWAETEMFWPLSHMNVEGEKALSCRDCHSRNGRLAGLPGVYIAGQSRNWILDTVGWLSVLGAFLMVLAHAFLRLLGRWGKLPKFLRKKP